ncbi:MAG: nucleotidyl transferase AbiEii/AbiGii toxin family protein, partial [Rectinemataceae bacterium]|nr:nucleotidyl transferase AbiEii/AbiGii toxin family protein [Rectinemataceae bacterium]
MKTDALRLAKSAHDPIEAGNLLREYVQARILGSLHESRAFESLSFVGGTALRFLYALPRFSEDLDFSLETPDGYDAARWLKKLKRDLEFQGFDA